MDLLGDLLAFFLGLLVLLLGFSTLDLGEGIEAVHHLLVSQWVVALAAVVSHRLLCMAETFLHLVGIDDLSQIGVAHHRSQQLVSTLDDGFRVGGTEQLAQVLERTLSPNDETAKLASRGQLEEVEAVHVGHLHTRDVAEGFSKLGVLMEVHNEGTFAYTEALATCLAHASAHGTSRNNLLHILEGTYLLQEFHGILSLLNALQLIFNHQRHLRDLANTVASSEHQGDDTASSQG